MKDKDRARVKRATHWVVLSKDGDWAFGIRGPVNLLVQDRTDEGVYAAADLIGMHVWSRQTNLSTQRTTKSECSFGESGRRRADIIALKEEKAPRETEF